MRTVSGPQLALLNGATFNIHAKLEIKNAAGTWQDYTSFGGKDYFLSATVDANVDSPVWSLRAQLKRDGEAATESLSPLRGDSTLNAGGPALNAARQWRLTVAPVASGASPSGGDWVELCAGYLDKPDFTNDPLTVEGRSVGARLLDSSIRVKRTYSGSLASVAQQIVNDNLPSPVPSLYIPVAPSFTVTEYTPYQVSVMDALVTLALSTGWMVRDVYDPADSTMKTALLDPGRARSADTTISPAVYLTVDQASLDVSNVRNVIEGEYVDAVTGEVGSVTVTDPASIAAFGGVERYMKFSEDATSPIDSGNEMLDMVNAALADLSTPKFDHVVTSTLFWPSEIADLYEFASNAVHYDTPQTLGVFGISHTLEGGHGVTQWTCRGAPAGAYLEWIRRQGAGPTGPDVPPSPILEFLVSELTQFGGTLDTVDGALWLGYRMPKGVDEIRIHALLGMDANIGVPNIDSTTGPLVIRRPEGDIGTTDEYASICILSTRPNLYKRIVFYGVKGGLTSKQVVAPDVDQGALQAIDPTPTPVDGTVASLNVARSGSTCTVTVTPGTLETDIGTNWLFIIRNKHILPPILIGTSTDPVVFVDSGLEESKLSTYAYETCIANLGETWCVTGGKPLTLANGPVAVVPVFALGTPILANVSGVNKVQLSWTCATPSAVQIRVEASLDLVTTRIVGVSSSVSSGTLYDTDISVKNYRLVALGSLGPIAWSPWSVFNQSPGPVSNPGAIPSFINGTPKPVASGSFPNLVLKLSIQWKCASPTAQIILVESSVDNGVTPFAEVARSAAVATGTVLLDASYVFVDTYYRLRAITSAGATVATSAVSHYIPRPN